MQVTRSLFLFSLVSLVLIVHTSLFVCNKKTTPFKPCHIKSIHVSSIASELLLGGDPFLPPSYVKWWADEERISVCCGSLVVHWWLWYSSQLRATPWLLVSVVAYLICCLHFPPTKLHIRISSWNANIQDRETGSELSITRQCREQFSLVDTRGRGLLHITVMVVLLHIHHFLRSSLLSRPSL